MSAAGRLQTEGTSKISGVVIKEHIVKKGDLKQMNLIKTNDIAQNKWKLDKQIIRKILRRIYAH